MYIYNYICKQVKMMYIMYIYIINYTSLIYVFVFILYIYTYTNITRVCVCVELTPDCPMRIGSLKWKNQVRNLDL